MDGLITLLKFMFSGDGLYTLAFAILGMLAVLGALGVVLLPNIVHATMCLLLTFLSIAGIYMQAGAGFVGIIQIMVYAGAITILIVFAVMLIMDRDPGHTNPVVPHRGKLNWWAAFGSILFVATMFVVAFRSLWPTNGNGINENVEVQSIANLFLGEYVVAFEAAAVLLLVAVIGAIILAKGVEDK